MNIMTWNIRGMNTDDKLSPVFTLIRSHKLSILSLVENKLSTDNIIKLKLRFPQWSLLHNNDTGSKGRILVLLDDTIWKYDILTISQKHITVLLTNQGGFLCNCTIVYASNSFTEQQQLWELLRHDASTIRLPWFVLGDFNNALNITDKKGGIPIPFSTFILLDVVSTIAALSNLLCRDVSLHGGAGVSQQILIKFLSTTTL